MITSNSTLREVYDTPIGHDVLKKVLMQLGLSDSVITGPIVGNIKLKNLTRLSKLVGKKLDPWFVESMIRLINSEPDVPKRGNGEITEKWWKEAVFYQVYPRTFRDTDGDGIGDLRGIIEKLDYLKDLGVDALWLSPIYDSPNDDNGYDIRDYRKIMKEFGSMEDFDELLSGLHDRDMRLIMDLVVNHTSDEHKWFKKAIKDPDSKYRYYYYLYPSNGTASINGKRINASAPPNNWTSFFSGPAWKKYGPHELWGLHLFSQKQPDLNWENAEVRREVVSIINFWLDKGVDGFRMDVANYYSKDGLADGDNTIGEMFGFYGIEHYMFGPHLHEYYRQLRDEAFGPHDAFTVGETAGLGSEMAKLITAENRGELDMVFTFDHLETPGHVRFDDYVYDLNFYRDYMIEWIENYGSDCWSSLFYNNHDNPRMVSKVNPDPAVKQPLEILLATMLLTLKGTPFIYQGDEMGLVNYDFKSIDEITDIESKNKYAELIAEGKSEEEAFATILAGTREHARRLLPWNDQPAETIDHLRQRADEYMLAVYKNLIELRHKHKALVYGSFSVMNKSKGRFTYMREYKQSRIVVDLNLEAKATKHAFNDPEYKTIFAPLADRDNMDYLSPYEARIWIKK